MPPPPASGLPPEFRPPLGYGGPVQPVAPYEHGGPGLYGSYVAPPPMAQQWAAGPPAHVALQRPGVVGTATTMAATASAQWVCALAFFWLLAGTGARQLATTGMDGALFHLLNRFHYRMVDGLAWPLFLFPLASFVLSFLLLTGRGWARVAFSAVGGAWLLWTAWLFRDSFVWWLPSAAYVATSVLLLWTASANRWFGRRSHPAGQPL